MFWKPTVNCLDGTWRAHISFFDHDVSCNPQWTGWFAAYRAFQLYFARLAAQASVILAGPLVPRPLWCLTVPSLVQWHGPMGLALVSSPWQCLLLLPRTGIGDDPPGYQR